MYGYVLQDWITIRGTVPASPASPDIIQGESTWMGFSSFQDIVFWLDIREMTLPGGTSPTLAWYFETSPSKDNNLFTTMTSVGPLSSLTPGVQLPSGALPRVILASNPSVPLATWARWRVSPAASSGLSGTWDATFRILCAANRVVRDRGAAMFA